MYFRVQSHRDESSLGYWRRVKRGNLYAEQDQIDSEPEAALLLPQMTVSEWVRSL